MQTAVSQDVSAMRKSGMAKSEFHQEDSHEVNSAMQKQNQEQMAATGVIHASFKTLSMGTDSNL